jgi:hypothetical protein
MSRSVVPGGGVVGIPRARMTAITPSVNVGCLRASDGVSE